MSKLFQRLKKQRSKNNEEKEQQLQSPPTTPTSVNSVGTQSEPLPASFHLSGLLNSSSQSNEPQRSSAGGGHDEVDGTMFNIQSSLVEERVENWPSMDPSSPSQPIKLPPPLIPSPPFTLSRSPTPSGGYFNSISSQPDQFPASPTHSTPSLTFPNLSSSSPQRHNYKHSYSTPANLPAGPLSTPVTGKTSRSSQIEEERERKEEEEEEEEDGEGDEIHQCRTALQALEKREKKLISEVSELRTELQDYQMPPPSTPHPETVVADLEESLRQAGETVEAVQGERDELKDGVDRMRDELISLKRSNSLLARRKQQWMEVASQTKVVLEENKTLINQYKAQQLMITDLRTQHHSKVAEMEGKMERMRENENSVEFQLKQMMETQDCILQLISRFVGVSLNNVQGSEVTKHLASLLERYSHQQSRELTSWRNRAANLEREKELLKVKIEEARRVTGMLETELRTVQKVVREGEETVARLQSQLEEVEEREEATQLQLAHALSQVDKAMTERDTYARIARRWQAVQRSEGERESAKAAVEEAHYQLQSQAEEHRVQRRRYKTEIHRLRSLLAIQDSDSRDSSSRQKMLRRSNS